MVLRSIVELMQSFFENQKKETKQQTDFGSTNILKVTTHSLKEFLDTIEVFLRFLA